MKVKIKYQDIIANTEKATLFLLRGNEKQWIPNFLWKYAKNGKYLIVDKSFAVKNKLYFKNYINIPIKIEPIYNQEVIDELKY